MKKEYKCENWGFRFDTSLEPMECLNCVRANSVYLEMRDKELITNINNILK